MVCPLKTETDYAFKADFACCYYSGYSPTASNFTAPANFQKRGMPFFSGVITVSITIFRYYTPEIGRWISRDPIEESGGENIYNSCANNLVNKIDYIGLWSSISTIGVDDHTPFTGAAFDSVSLTADDEVKEEMREVLIEANLSVDDGVYFENNYWHFNRNDSDSALAGKAQYLLIAYGNTAKYFMELASVDPCKSPEEADKLCQSALERLGRLSHAWQDYYAHAVANSYTRGSPPSSVGTVSPSSNPYFPDPSMKPSSYNTENGGEHGEVGFGNALTGSYEPGNRAPDTNARRSASVSFTASMFQSMLPIWIKVCECTKTVQKWKK